MCSATGPPVTCGGTQTARATRGDASPARNSKSSAVTAEVAGPDLHRRALAGVVERLGVDATVGRLRVGDGVDAGQRRAQGRERAGGDVAGAPAAVAVAGEAHERALRRDRAVLGPAAVGLAD